MHALASRLYRAECILKYNQAHDQRGRFAHTGGGSKDPHEKLAADIHATMGAGEFGDKVFITTAFDRLKMKGKAKGMSYQDFKAVLPELNRKGLIHLSRADFVEVMDPRKVAISETKYLNTRWHFINPPAKKK